MATPLPKELAVRALVRRVLRDYVSHEWGLLILAVFCMLAGWATALGRRGVVPGTHALIAFAVVFLTAEAFLAWRVRADFVAHRVASPIASCR